MGDGNIVAGVNSRLLQCLVASGVLHGFGRVDLHTVRCLFIMPKVEQCILQTHDDVPNDVRQQLCKRAAET
jgi:hypothetical protein